MTAYSMDKNLTLKEKKNYIERAERAIQDIHILATYNTHEPCDCFQINQWNEHWTMTYRTRDCVQIAVFSN